MKHNLILLPFLLLAQSLFAQWKDTVGMLIPIHAQKLQVDAFSQIYALNKANEWLKYDLKANLLGRFSSFGRNGTYLDNSNPQNLVLYSPNFLQVEVLDRTLSPVANYRLTDQNILQANAIARSYDGHLWVFDETDFTLKKIGNNEILAQSVNMSLELGISLVGASRIVENEDRIYVSVPDFGLLVFDNFGQFISSYRAIKATDFQVIGKKILFYQAPTIFIFDTEQQSMETILCPIPGVSQIALVQGHWVVLTLQGVRIFSH